ncbi:MAG TPA: clostripain-related cysteine peptidase [Candidatus Mcinerneyibacteriales bacterium]|nr:clostripain-related cysteine peptidase [Candidatus Mcinerneyibacteriales bacterium]
MKNRRPAGLLLIWLLFLTPLLFSFDLLLYVSGNNTLGDQAEALDSWAQALPSDGPHRLLFQVSYGGATVRRLRGGGESSDVLLTQADMGDEATLSDFLDWAEDRRTGGASFLALWGHGNNWYPDYASPAEDPDAIAWDALSGLEIFFSEKTASSVFNGHRFTLILLDACRMASVENFYALAPFGDVIAASAHNLPADAFDYASLFTLAPETSQEMTAALFNLFVNKGTAWSLTAVSGPQWRASVESAVEGSFPSEWVRSSFAGVTPANTLDVDASDIDASFLSGWEGAVLHRESSESSFGGVSLFFPPDYVRFKASLGGYRELAFEITAHWLERLAAFYGKEDIAPEMLTSPRVEGHSTYSSVDPGTWYDFSGPVTYVLFAGESLLYLPLDLTLLENNSGLAVVSGMSVTLNGGDAAVFENSDTSLSGYLELHLSYAVAPGETGLVSVSEDGTAFEENNWFSATGEVSLFFPKSIRAVRVEITGSASEYRGVTVTTRRRARFSQGAEEALTSARTFPYVWSAARMGALDSRGNLSVAEPSMASGSRRLVYPNPLRGSGTLHFGSSVVEILLYDARGRLLQMWSGRESIDLSGYPSGLYYVRLDGDLVPFVRVR